MESCTVEFRVRYSETDKMGVVYYSNYLVWFEVARTEFFRKKIMEYRHIEDDMDVYLPVVEAYCKYRTPLFYDDPVEIIATLADVKNSEISFDYEIRKDGRVTTTGHTRHAFVGKSGRPVPIPANIREKLLACISRS